MGDVSNEDILIASNILFPELIEFLDHIPVWSGGMSDNAMVTLSHIYSSFRKRLSKMKFINAEKFKKLPDGFLFDTDNTLYHYEPAHNYAWDETKKKISKTLTIDEKNRKYS